MFNGFSWPGLCWQGEALRQPGAAEEVGVDLEVVVGARGEGGGQRPARLGHLNAVYGS